MLWVQTEGGKRMPIDVASVPNGNVVKTGATVPSPFKAARPVDVVRVLTVMERTLFDAAGDDAEVPPDQRFVSHFATRPDAAGHRRT